MDKPTAASERGYDLFDTYEDGDGPRRFAENTMEYVRYGDCEVEAGRMTVDEQSRRIRAALADALAWIERGGPSART